MRRRAYVVGHVPWWLGRTATITRCDATKSVRGRTRSVVVKTHGYNQESRCDKERAWSDTFRDGKTHGYRQASLFDEERTWSDTFRDGKTHGYITRRDATKMSSNSLSSSRSDGSL